MALSNTDPPSKVVVDIEKAISSINRSQFRSGFKATPQQHPLAEQFLHRAPFLTQRFALMNSTSTVPCNALSNPIKPSRILLPSFRSAPPTPHRKILPSDSDSLKDIAARLTENLIRENSPPESRAL
jgi:hypothetical protein